MAQKLTNDELENVSGGGCGYYSYCPVCNKRVSGGDWWKATYTDPKNGKKTRYGMCKKCADERINDPNWSDWQYYKNLD